MTIGRTQTLVLAAGAGLILLCAGCVQESRSIVGKKLAVIVGDDLKSVVEELPPASIADSAYHEIALFESDKEGEYSAKAVVDFYLLKDVSVKMTRKYRYHRRLGMWERYTNEWRFFNDSTQTQ